MENGVILRFFVFDAFNKWQFYSSAKLSRANWARELAWFIDSWATTRREFAHPYVSERQLAEVVAGEIRLRLAFCEKATEQLSFNALHTCRTVAKWYFFAVIDSKGRTVTVYRLTRLDCYYLQVICKYPYRYITIYLSTRIHPLVSSSLFEITYRLQLLFLYLSNLSPSYFSFRDENSRKLFWYFYLIHRMFKIEGNGDNSCLKKEWEIGIDSKSAPLEVTSSLSHPSHPFQVVGLIPECQTFEIPLQLRSNPAWNAIFGHF